jgi:L-2-hydroxyglutarate oxidase LhgO
VHLFGKKIKRNYERDREPIEAFARGAKLLLPELEVSGLVPAYWGIRAKLTPPKERVADFIIQPDPQFPRVVRRIGIESPRHTSAPSIAEQVRDLAVEILG